MRERNERACGGDQQPAEAFASETSARVPVALASRPNRTLRLANWEYTAGYVSRYSRLPIPSHWHRRWFITAYTFKLTTNLSRIW